MSLPVFTLDGYADLLVRLDDLGYDLRPASSIRMAGPHERVVFLRHDVDLHLEGALEMAEVEQSMKGGVRSTWHVGTRLAYNPAFAPNAEVIRALAAHGHTIGLHYVAGQRWILPDLELLEELSGFAPVGTWVMHEPSAGGEDLRCDRAPHTTGNPHAYGLHYVSDSGMRWREPWIGELLAGTHDRVMLNTHHEHWLGDGNRSVAAADAWTRATRQNDTYLHHLLGGYY